MAEGMTCYERDEAFCEDQMCLRFGCRLRNKRLDHDLASVPALLKALEDLHQKAGTVATWINHWGVSFSDQDEWRGSTGDARLFFDALNEAAAVLAAYRK